ncbi:MAG: hypothetical protein H6713_17690 [Myxococcales bacterium]|nr:hypothetical protein [Myxococcales bacterium]
MTLRLVEKNPTAIDAEVVSGAEADAAEEVVAPARRRAPSAPPSPGTLPLAYAKQLRQHEALIWWGVKDAIEPRPVLWVVGVCAAVLVLVTAFYPGFWWQPWASLWRPLAVLFAPALLVLLRQFSSRRATLITDNSVIDIPRRGEPARLGFDSVRKVRRDLWTGGMRLEGARHTVRVPQELADDARRAIASQRHGMVRASERPDDPEGWMP